MTVATAFRGGVPAGPHDPVCVGQIDDRSPEGPDEPAGAKFGFRQPLPGERHAEPFFGCAEHEIRGHEAGSRARIEFRRPMLGTPKLPVGMRVPIMQQAKSQQSDSGDEGRPERSHSVALITGTSASPIKGSASASGQGPRPIRIAKSAPWLDGSATRCSTTRESSIRAWSSPKAASRGKSQRAAKEGVVATVTEAL